MRYLQLAPAVLCVGLIAAAPAFADGVVLNGISPRSLSRGGTNIAHADNGAILHDNPAAMVNVEGEGIIEVGVIGLLSDFGYSDPDNPAGVHSNSFTPLPQFSYVRKSADGMWAYGLGVFAEAGFMEDYTMQGPVPFGGPREYKSFGALAKVLPGVSLLLNDNLSIGGTFGVGVSHVEFEGPYTLQGPMLPGVPTLVDVQGTGATPVWSLGLQYLLTESTTVGVTYLSASHFELQGNARVTIPGLPTFAYDSVLEMEWPQSVGVGVRHQLSPYQALSADVIWFDWSGAFDQLELRLRNPANPFFPAVDETTPLGWRDSVSLRVGYEHDLEVGTVRLGYVYNQNPIPDATLTPFIQATLQHSFSLGYGFDWGDWQVDAGYMFLFGPQQTVVDSQLLGGDFDNSVHTAAMHALFIGFQKPL